jgi:hypothetical protein
MWVMGMYLRMSMQELLLILIKRINLWGWLLKRR